MNTELLGYVASVLVALSLTMTNLWRLRWVNLAGAITFSVYGVLIAAWPIAIVNAFIAVVNVHFLWKMAHSQDVFEWLKVADDDAVVERLVRFHTHDILRFFPEFDYEALRQRDDDHWLLVLRNAIPVGLCVLTLRDDVAEIDLDYVAPAYRDSKNGRFLYDRLVRRLARRGVTKIVSNTEVSAHQKYLLRMGFRSEGGAGRLVRDVA